MCAKRSAFNSAEINTTESTPQVDLLTFTDIIEFRAEHEPEKPAFAYYLDGESDVDAWNYRDLKNAIALVSQKLAQYSLDKKPVLLIFEPGLTFIATYLATISSGAIAVPCHPPIGKRQVKRLHKLILDCKPSLVLYSGNVRRTTPQLDNLVSEFRSKQCKIEEFNLPDNITETQWLHPEIAPDSLAMLQYTSASTGAPKGVILDQQNLVANSRAIYQWLEPHSQRRGCVWLPPYHDMGLLGGIMQPLYAGFPLSFMSPMHFVQQPIRWIKLLSDNQLTTTGAPNFAFQLCVDTITDEELHQHHIDLSCVREVFCGSEPINAQTMQEFNAKFIPFGLPETAINPCYGMAETTLFISGKPANTKFRHHLFSKTQLEQRTAELTANSMDAIALVSSGKPDSQFALKIVDPDTKEELKNKQVGEIWLHGPSVARGYFGQTTQTMNAFCNILQTENACFYRSGDLGFIFNGELYVTGRIKDIIIIRGRNLYPQDIENCALHAIEDQTGVFAAAFAIHHQAIEHLVVVVEVKGKPSDESIDAMQHAISAAITGEFNVRPHEVLVVPQLSIPRTTSGKVQRFASRDAWENKTLRTFARGTK